MNGKTAIITGASAGIGLETAYSLMKHNCFVVFACRNLEKTKKAVEKLAQTKFFNTSLYKIIALDLSDLENVKQFSEEVKQNFK